MLARYWKPLTAAALGLAALPPGGAAPRQTQPPISRLTVHVGDGTVDGTQLAPFTSHFRMTRTTPEGQTEDGGTWTDWVRIVDRHGGRVLEREVTRYTPEGVVDLWRLHENDLETLAPIFTLQKFGDGLAQTVKMDFDGRSIRYEARQSPQAPPQAANLTVDQPVFDLSLWAILLRGFPLEENYTASFPVLGQAGALEWETVTVDGRETLTLEGGREVSTLVVSTSLRPWTVWLMDDAPYIAKVIQRLPDGSEVLSELRR